MKHWTPLSLLLIALTMGVWSNADANSLLLADRPGDVYLFTPDNTTTLSLIARAKDFPIARYGVAEGKDSIYNLTYEPFRRKLYAAGGIGTLYVLDASSPVHGFQKVDNIEPPVNHYFLYFDREARRVITESAEFETDKRGDPVLKRLYFVYLDNDGTWRTWDEKKPFNCVRHQGRLDYYPGGNAEPKGKDLLPKHPGLAAEVEGFDENAAWQLIGRSENLTLYGLVSVKSKDGRYPNLAYLIEDRHLHSSRVVSTQGPGGGALVYKDFCVVYEAVKRENSPEWGPNGDWYLYYSGAKEVFKTRLEKAFDLKTADEDKGLLYFTANQVLYEVPVSIDGWGKPKKLAKLPIEPDWVFVVPERP